MVEAKYRVLRGGSWDTSRAVARAAYRFRSGPGYRDNLIGFRVVRAPALFP
jgi:formylglycine-generating enzyme required for sulfatase activity